MLMGNGNQNICWQTELCPVDCPVNQSMELFVFFISFGWIVVVLVTKILGHTFCWKSKVVFVCVVFPHSVNLGDGEFGFDVFTIYIQALQCIPSSFCRVPKICHHKQTCSNAPKRKSKDIRLVRFSQTCSNQKSSEIQVYLFKHPINADQTHLHFVSPEKVVQPTTHQFLFKQLRC